MERSWLWDKKVSLSQIKNIFRDETHPRFIEFSALLLARKNTPKEIFKEYFSPLVFCRNWQRIKKRMRQDSWNNPRIEFWQAIYEKLIEKYKQKDIIIQPEKKEIQPVNELAVDIAQKIIAIRKEKGFTQEDLAKESGVSQQMISRIESGQHNISLATLKKIADSLGCAVKADLIDKE